MDEYKKNPGCARQMQQDNFGTDAKLNSGLMCIGLIHLRWSRVQFMQKELLALS